MNSCFVYWEFKKKKLGICFTDVFPATSLFPNREFFLDVFVPVSAISQNLRRLLKATKKSKRGDVVEKPVEWKFVNCALFFFLNFECWWPRILRRTFFFFCFCFWILITQKFGRNNFSKSFFFQFLEYIYLAI